MLVPTTAVEHGITDVADGDDKAVASPDTEHDQLLKGKSSRLYEEIAVDAQQNELVSVSLLPEVIQDSPIPDPGWNARFAKREGWLSWLRNSLCKR